MSAQGPQVPPGWYPDPTTQNSQRYWDGTQWTEHVQPMVDTPPQPAPTTPMAQPGQPAPQQFQAGAQQGTGQFGSAYQANPGYPVDAADPARQPGVNPYAAAPAKSGMSTTTKVLLFLLLGFVVLLGGCTALIAFAASEGSQQIAEIEEQIAEAEEAVDAAQDAAAEEGVGGGLFDEDQTAAELNDGGTRDDPFAYNETIDITWRTFGDAEDSVWSTTVGPPRDVTAEILAENEFNDDPPEGTVFVGFDVEMTLVSATKEPLAPGFNFTWEILGGSTAAAYDQSTIETDFFGCGVTPNTFDTFDEVFIGGTVTGLACIPLPIEDLESGNTQVAMHFLDDSRVVFGP